MEKEQPLPDAIYDKDGEYLTLHSQGIGESVYEDKDGVPRSIDNEYAYSLSDDIINHIIC